VDALLCLTRALLEQDRYEEAERTARVAVQVAPTDGYTHYLLGFVLQVAGRHADSIASLREAVRLDPRVPNYHARLAIALSESGAKEEAQLVIDAVASLDTQDALLIDECAYVYSLLAQHDRAEQFARRAIALRPADPKAHWRLAWVLANRRAFAASAAAARAALAIDPNSWAAWEELGYALFEQGVYDQAEAALAEALRLKPGLSSAALRLATLYRRQGRLARAERVCDEALRIDPRNEQLSRVREFVRAKRTQLEQHRNFHVGALAMWAILSVILAPTAPSMRTLALYVLIALAAAVLAFVVAEPEPVDDAPAPSPSLLVNKHSDRPEEQR
jgi:tetratricopeptide (TPR) repeat protein